MLGSRYDYATQMEQSEFRVQLNGLITNLLDETCMLILNDLRDTLLARREIKRFHTPDALREMLGRDLVKAGEWLISNPPTHTKLRPYQKEANVATEKAIAEHNRTAQQRRTDHLFDMLRACR